MKCDHRWATPSWPTEGLRCEHCATTFSFFEMSDAEANAIEDENLDREEFVDAFRECVDLARRGQAAAARAQGEDVLDPEYD